MRKKPSELDFEEYIRQVEPAKREKSYAWSTAIGLQQVDGLTPSDYLLEVAKKNIEGKISLNKAQTLIDSYYESKTERTEDQDEKEEADKVSARIAQILSEKAFSFSPFFFISIHKRLFDRVFKHAGEIRKYNISKKEWVLNGDSVMYGASFELRMALDYDFEREREFNYSNLSMDEIVRHLSSFVSRLWQIHAFGEGNLPSSTCVPWDSRSGTTFSPKIRGISGMPLSERTTRMCEKESSRSRNILKNSSVIC